MLFRSCFCYLNLRCGSHLSLLKSLCGRVVSQCFWFTQAVPYVATTALNTYIPRTVVRAFGTLSQVKPSINPKVATKLSKIKHTRMVIFSNKYRLLPRARSCPHYLNRVNGSTYELSNLWLGSELRTDRIICSPITDGQAALLLPTFLPQPDKSSKALLALECQSARIIPESRRATTLWACSARQ